MRECHFLAKVRQPPVGSSKKAMLLPLVFYALLIFWCFFSFCVLKFMFPRVRFELPAAILTQNAFSSKFSSKKCPSRPHFKAKSVFLLSLESGAHSEIENLVFAPNRMLLSLGPGATFSQKVRQSPARASLRKLLSLAFGAH